MPQFGCCFRRDSNDPVHAALWLSWENNTGRSGGGTNKMRRRHSRRLDAERGGVMSRATRAVLRAAVKARGELSGERLT